MSIVRSHPITPSFVPLTLGHAIRTAAARNLSKSAILFEDKSLSYGALVSRMNQVANTACGLGLRAGDVAVIIAPNCQEYIEVVTGLADAGIIVAVLNPQLAEKEFRAAFEDCQPRLLVVHPDCRDRVASCAPDNALTLTLGTTYETALARAADRYTPVPVEEWQPFIISYTSGTAGAPKGALLPHRSRMLTILAMAAEYGCFGPDETFLVMTPLYHGAGFAFGAANLTFGGTSRIMPRFDGAEVMRRLGNEPVTGMFVVPTLLKRLAELPESEFAAGRHNLLKAIISNASALPQPLKEQAIDAFGEGLLHETYGSTEGGIVTNICPIDQLRKPNSVGVPFFGTEIELRDENGKPVKNNEPGELFSRSPYLFNGYRNRPQETAEVLRDGWVTAGDMATRDSEGYFYIVDRKKDMIISGGVNIYPREIENVISSLPGIAETAVVGRPDPEWGERVHAFIVTEPGAQVAEETILNECRAHLAGYKQPRGISFIEALPRNAGGKILKRDLRQRGAEPSSPSQLA